MISKFSVISAIHTRGGSRTYAQGLAGAAAIITLNPEGQQALASAARGERRCAPPTDRHRRKDAS